MNSEFAHFKIVADNKYYINIIKTSVNNLYCESLKQFCEIA